MSRGFKPHQPKEQRFSLWLRPSGSARRSLARLIRELGTEHHTPPFEPHVTLLGRITMPRREVILLSANLAKFLRPLSIYLTVPDHRNERFRCLFVKAAKTVALLKAHRLARQNFQARALPRFLPHLSLVYGNLALHVKREIIRSLGRQCEIKFEVKSLDLYSTTGEPENWYRVKSFRLT